MQSWTKSDTNTGCTNFDDQSFQPYLVRYICRLTKWIKKKVVKILIHANEVLQNMRIKMTF